MMEIQETRTIDYVREPERMGRASIDVLRRLIARYPYYQTLRLLLLRNLYRVHDPSFNEELHRCALLVADRSVLFDMVEGVNYEIPAVASPVAPATPDEAGGDRTLSLIDSFLDSVPEEKPKRQPSAVDASTDYVAYLMAQEEMGEEKDEEEMDGIPAFPLPEEPKRGRIVLREKPDEAYDTPKEDETPREEYFTETLAQIYIKQEKYERALEIIRALYSNNPKKNGYFADQIRFLEKLILINKNKSK